MEVLEPKKLEEVKWTSFCNAVLMSPTGLKEAVEVTEVTATKLSETLK